ncbi:hypothetical protein DRV85_04975 [Rhodosalinus halophilus]|uniref:Uncharacterized protein n=1 Tax=Rhodosalinus halophilus TaxID=2259333 RepID=A0A365UBX1_9RHOB|nr:hypothetical protein [Rhodosalinus halophilus]RBI86772.1 hypothetical protein DRV85_04975 [Rhodosalinus halophilus]
MPDLIRLYIRQVAIGFVISAAFVAMILWFNVANLWHLVTHDPAGPLAVGLLWMFNGIVFSGVQFGISIMRMAEKDDGDGGTHAPEAVEYATIPARADDAPRRRI